MAEVQGWGGRTSRRSGRSPLAPVRSRDRSGSQSSSMSPFAGRSGWNQRPPLDVEWRLVGHKVEHRAMRIDVGLESIEVRFGRRAAQGYGAADLAEARPHGLIHREEAAQIDVALERHR